jgi:hypothetical protein
MHNGDIYDGIGNSTCGDTEYRIQNQGRICFLNSTHDMK